MNPPELGGFSWKTTQIGELASILGTWAIFYAFARILSYTTHSIVNHATGVALVVFQVLAYNRCVDYFGVLCLIRRGFLFQVRIIY